MKINKSKHVTKDGVVKKNPAKSDSSSKVVTYSGSWTGTDPDGKLRDDWIFSFNLYNEDENMNFEETKENLMSNMRRNHLPALKELFSLIGLKLHDLVWYSPKQYNYGGDSIDLKISIASKTKLKTFIIHNKDAIQEMLDGNKSYDGYMSLTKSDIEEVLEEIDEDSEVDPIVIAYILTKHPLDYWDDFREQFVLENDDED